MIDEEKNEMPPLGGTRKDLVVSLGKGAVGAIPLAGSLLAEIVGQLIPEQRSQRIEVYVRKLDERLEELEGKFSEDAAKRAENIDLFEEGALQSVRALSEERIEYISKLVASGMTGAEKDRIEAKRLLSLLRSVDDDQIIVLTSYLQKHWQDGAFYKKHASILEPVRAAMGSGQDQLDKATVHELARQQLKDLGLLRSRFSRPKKGEIPEIDPNTGTLKSSGTDLTPLGRLLLRKIGLCGANEH